MNFSGVRVDEVTYQEALERVQSLLKEPGSHYVVTPNPEMVVEAQRDSEFREVLNKADLSIPDGVGLVFWSKITRGKLKERVAGVDLVGGLVNMGSEFGYKLFLLGGSATYQAVEKLNTEYKDLKIGWAFGPQLDKNGMPISHTEEETEREVIKKINTFKPDILLVAFGAPKQEKWIARNTLKADFKLALGVGGALDFISGSKKRAPKIVQNLGLEWLHRLMNEPSRIKRQMTIPKFVVLSLKNLFNKKS